LIRLTLPLIDSLVINEVASFIPGGEMKNQATATFCPLARVIKINFAWIKGDLYVCCADRAKGWLSAAG